MHRIAEDDSVGSLLAWREGWGSRSRARDLGSYSGSAMQHTFDLKAKQHTLRSSASSSVKQKQSIICKTTLPSSQDFWKKQDRKAWERALKLM